MIEIDQITMRMLRMPLTHPYWSMISTLHAFDVIVSEIRLNDGSKGFGECVIVNGYTQETIDGGWSFCKAQAQELIGLGVDEARLRLLPHVATQSHAVSCLLSGMDMALGHPLLTACDAERRIPVLAPLHSKESASLAQEIEARLHEGYLTLKVKVGEDVDADLKRVRWIQDCVAGRGVIRLDANQGYSSEAACKFVSELDPAGIELLEQPCHASDWDAAVRVKSRSNVPMMLDESIYGRKEIEQAGALAAARYIKLKLVKTGGVDELVNCLGAIGEHDMVSVLGSGVATEIGNWMEACVAYQRVETASEANGFLKPAARLFANPLALVDGFVVMPAHYYPEIDAAQLTRHTLDVVRY